MWVIKVYVTIKVNGMMCDHCKKKVDKELQSIKSVKKVKIDLESQLVSFIYNENKVNLDVIKEAIVELGYEV